MSNDYRLPDSEYLARRFSVPHLICLMVIFLILSIFLKALYAYNFIHCIMLIIYSLSLYSFRKNWGENNKCNGPIPDNNSPYTVRVWRYICIPLRGAELYSGIFVFYTCYITYIASFVISYLYTQRKPIYNKSNTKNKPRYVFTSLLFTFLAFIIYLPVLMEFREYIF